MPHEFSRRNLLGGAVGALSLAGPAQSAPALTTPQTPRFGVSSYSYWHFKKERYPIEKVIEDAGRLGFAGVEVLHRQMTDESPQYLNRLKQTAIRNGVALTMFSIHQDFVSPWEDERGQAIRHTQYGIDMAVK